MVPAISSNLLSQFTWKHERTADLLSTGIEHIDQLIEGCPRGRITEITGPVSSGRTSLLHSILAEGSRLGEFCALVDAANAFDPHSAAAAGVDLKRLVWIRCGGNAEHAMRAADLIIHGGGFGVVALDLCEVEPRLLRRIPLSYWYRFRRAIENTPCALVLLSREPQAKACASVLAQMHRDRATFAGRYPFETFRSATFTVAARKPLRAHAVKFEAALQS
jgi:recombination protein RecA